MADNPVVGEWGNFVFKMVEPSDHPKILKHMRDYFYYRALYRLGYTKDMDDEMDELLRGALNDDGDNLSFYAEDRTTGKVAGARIIKIEKRGPRPPSPLKNRICRGISNFYNELVDECNVFERYGLDECPHMFGLAVDPEFCQQGLATEIYRRAKALVKAKGYPVAIVGFISPYSRAAGNHNGFVKYASKPLLEAKDDEGNVLYPEADPNDFHDTGVFEIQ